MAPPWERVSIGREKQQQQHKISAASRACMRQTNGIHAVHYLLVINSDEYA